MKILNSIRRYFETLHENRSRKKEFPKWEDTIGKRVLIAHYTAYSIPTIADEVKVLELKDNFVKVEFYNLKEPNIKWLNIYNLHLLNILDNTNTE